MKKLIILLIVMCFVLAGCSQVGKQNDVNADKTIGAADKGETLKSEAKENRLSSVKSYDEVYQLLHTLQSSTYRDNASMDTDMKEDAVAEAGTNTSGSGDYSETNIQTEGVDEGDIVKTDGKYIYYFDGSVLKIIEPQGAGTAIISVTDLYVENEERSLYFNDIYLSGSYIIAIGTEYNMNNYTDMAIAAVYNVSDPRNVKLVEEFGQSGYVSSTRLVGNILYIITNYDVWDVEDVDINDTSAYIPKLRTLENEVLVGVDDLCIPEELNSTSWITVTAYDVSNCTTVSTVSMLGNANEIYMSSNNIYVADTSWVVEESDEYTRDQYTVVECLDYAQTNIHKFGYSEGKVEYICTGAVKGSLLNQFSMDEYEGNLRIVTTNNDCSYTVYTDEKYGFENYEYNENSMDNSLYVLNNELVVIGSVNDLGQDERVYSVRFSGEIGYFVTYRETDPLFAVDLSTPDSPKVLSALKINGFSEYLHNWSEGLLLGIGMEADDEGNISTMKLSMFDVSDTTDVSESTRLVIPYSYSEGLYNHRAIFVDTERGLIGFGADEDYVIYKYTEEGFSEYTFVKGSNYGYGTRAVRIGEYIYVVGADDITVIDLANNGTVG